MTKLSLESPVGTDVEDVSQIVTVEKAQGIDTWQAQLEKIDQDLDPLDFAVINRDDTEYMRGRFKRPKKAFGPGSTMVLNGQGYAGELNRFITGSGTITNKTVTAALQEILDESPSDHSITLGTVDTFYFIKEPITELKTSLEFLTWEYLNTGVEFDEDAWEYEKIQVEGLTANKLPAPENRCCFEDINGRYFFFFSDGTNNVKYISTTDFSTFTAATDTGVNSSGSRIDVTYDPETDHCHVAIYTGGATAFYTGTISGSTITLTLKDASVFNANRYPVCSFMYETDNEHLWVIDSANHLWSSDDDGVTWVDEATLTNTGKFLFPIESSGGMGDDMYIIEYDAATNILELWRWDDGTSTETYIDDIKDWGADIMQTLTGTIDHQGQMHMVADDDNNEVWYIRILCDETIEVTKMASVGGAGINVGDITISVDNADSAYAVYSYGAGIFIRKYTDGVFIGQSTDYLDASGAQPQSPIKNRIGFNDQGGFYVTGGNQAGAARLLATLLGPEGIRISGGHTSGSFKTVTQSASVDMEQWGILSGLQVAEDNILYDIEDASDVDLVTGLSLDADLWAEGVPNTETDIVIQGNLTENGSLVTMVKELYLSERIDEIEEMTYGSEQLGDWLDRLVKITGAEYDLSTADVLTFVDELGTDHSASVTLEQGVNCTRISVEEDMDNYANIIRVLGDAAVEATIRDSVGIATYGEFWAKTIRDPDSTTTGAAWNRGSTALNVLKVMQKRIDVDFMDNQSGREISGILTRGDTVTVIDPKTGLSQSARFMEITRAGLNGERVSGYLVNAGRAQGVIDYWAELDDIRRQL